MRKVYQLSRLTEKVKVFAVMALIALLAVGNIFAEEVTYVFADAGFENETVISEGTIDDVISYTAAQNSASNPPKYYVNGTNARFYYNATKGCAMTLTAAPGYEITGLVINAVNNYAPTKITFIDDEQTTLLAPVSNVYTYTIADGTQSLEFCNTGGGENKQLRITSITVTYRESGDAPAVTVSAPTFSVPAGTYYTSKTVALSCETEGADIYFSIGDAEPVIYSVPFTVSETSTVTAYAQLGETKSSNVTVDYTIFIPTDVASIAEFMAKEDDENVIYRINNPITFNFGANKNIYVQDSTGALLIYDQNNIYNSYNPGDVINGGIIGTRALYNGIVEMKTKNGATAAAGEPGTATIPVVATMSEIAANPDAYMSKLVTIKYCKSEQTITYQTSGSTQYSKISQGDTMIQIRNQFKTLTSTMTEGKYYTVTGFVGYFKNNSGETLQIYPRGNGDIVAVGELPVAYDFDESGADAFTFLNANVNKWYTGTAQGFDNSKLFISSSNGATNKYNVSASGVSHAYIPVVIPEGSDVLLSFDFRSNGESNDFLQVSLLDNEPVAGTVPADFLMKEYNKGEFTHSEILIPAENAGLKFLVFTWSNNANNGNQTPAAVDNISIKATCTAISNIVATVENHNAVITWDAPEEQTAWTVEYKDARNSAWISQNVTEKTFTLSNLATDATYDVRVKTNCGDNSSVWTSANFNVPCDDLTTSDLDVTIGTGNGTTRNAPFGVYYKNAWVQMIYPASNFESDGYINSISWNVNSANSSSYSAIKIYLGTTSMNNHANTNDWLSMDDLTLVYESNGGSVGSASGWEKYELSTPYFYSNNENLVVVVSRKASDDRSLYYKSTSSTYSVLTRWNDYDATYGDHPATENATSRSSDLPNMKIEFTGYICGDEHCAAPAELVVNNVTTNSAKLTWNGDAASYKVSYKAEGNDEWTVATVPGTEIVLNDLADNTNYTATVVAMCNASGASTEATTSFTTVPECAAPTNLEVAHNIGNTIVSWMPVVNVNAYEVEYGVRNSDEMTSVIVNNVSSYTIAGLIENTQYDVRVRAICGEESVSEWTSTYFTRPTICSAPTAITVSNITTTTAKVKWNGVNANSYTIEYGVAGFAHGEGTTVTSQADSILITGLNPITTYSVCIKGDCDGYLSAWSSVKSFETDCAPFTITASTPWFEDFEGYTGGSNVALNSCWETPVMSATYSSPFVYTYSSSFSHSGSKTVELKGNYSAENVLVLPAFTNDISTLQLTFFGNTHASSASSAGTVEVGYVTDAADGSTFVAMQTVTPLTTSLNRANSDMYGPFNYSAVTAENARMAIHYKSPSGYSSMSWNLDDFTVEIIPNCQAPTSLEIVSFTGNSATVKWNAIGDETTWSVQYGETGFTPGEGTTVSATTNPFELTGLTNGTTYDIYVNAVCGAGNESAWVGPVTVTPKNVCFYRLNLTDSYGDGWNGNNITITQGGNTNTYTVLSGSSKTYEVALDNGIEAVFQYNITGSYSYPSENSFQIYDYNDSLIWSMNNGSGNDGINLTTTPKCAGEVEPEPGECTKTCEFTVVLNDKYDDGWVGNYSGNSPGSFVIIQNNEIVGEYTLDEGESPATHKVTLCDATPAQFVVNPDYYGDEMSIFVTNSSGDVIFEVEEGDYPGYTPNPDSDTTTITIDCGSGPAACIVPELESLAVDNITETSAHLYWEGDTLTKHQVEWREAASESWTTAEVTGIQYNITGLTANTTYIARVKAVCDVENNYTNEVMFFATSGSACQSELEIGDQSSTSYYYPVNNYYRNTYTQQIFTSDEIGQSGPITKLSFNYSYSSPMTAKSNVKIYLGHTDKSSFASTSESEWITEGLVEVYSGSLNCSQGWNEFELTAPFNYDNTKNLVVTVEDNSGNYNSSSYTFKGKTGSEYRSFRYYNDTYTWENRHSSSYISYYRDMFRNDIMFSFICPDDVADIALNGIEEIASGCDLSGTEVTLNIRNAASAPLNKVEAYYTVNGGAAVHETINFTEPLTSGKTYKYTFSTTANLTDSINVISAWVETNGDANFNNNTAVSNNIKLVEPADVPFVENFTSGSMHEGWYATDDNNDNVSFAFTSGKLTYTYNDTANANDWAVSACVYIPAGRYEVAYDYNANDAAFVEAFKVFYGQKETSDINFSEEIASHTFSNTGVVTARNQIEIENSGVYYFAFNALSAAGNMGFNIDNFSVKPLVRASVYYADNGTGTPEGVIYVAQGDDITVTITPDAGYHVGAIYKNQQIVRGENADNASVEYYTFTPNNYDNVYITFVANKYEINATVANKYETEYNDNAIGATYEPSHEVLGYGATHTGIITLAPYYHIENVYVNGYDMTSEVVEIDNTNGQYKLELTPIAENKTINVIVGLDSTKIVYTVLEGHGTINNKFVVDENTILPATYTETIEGYTSLLSTIVPADGYHVESIVIDGVEHNIIEAYSFEKIIGNHTVAVVFAKNHYVISTAGYGHGVVTDGEEFDYDPDKVYVFEATPAEGNHIVSVQRNQVELVITDPHATFTDTLRNILDNYDYKVLFASDKYTVVSSCGEHGTITPSGIVAYNYNDSIDYVINANQGYYIASVTVDGETTDYTQEDALTSTTVHFNANSGDHSVSATFAIFRYTITVNQGAHGTIAPETTTYDYNTTPAFTITPDEGYAIESVTVDGVEVPIMNSVYTFMPLSADHVLTASFAAYEYTITASCTDGGTITPAGVTNLIHGGNQAYTITPATGYEIAHVYVDGVEIATPTSTYTFTNVTANHTFYVVFEVKTFTITVNQPANGSITPSGIITVTYGATPSFVVTPNVGYTVEKITVNASTQVISNATEVNGVYTYKFPAVTANQSITATMKGNTYTITATSGTGGTITPAGNTTVNHGDTRSYSIAANDGYVVNDVVVDGISMGAISAYTFTNIAANHTIQATFKMAECVVPYNLQTTFIDSTSAVLNWYHPNAVSFDIQYKTPAGTFNSITGVTGSSYTLMGLTPSTTYLWQIRANCVAEGNHSAWSNMIAFTTENPYIEVGLEEFDPSQIKVYGEHQNVHIVNVSNVRAENVRIYDVYGKLIYQGGLNSEHEVIGLTVAAGTYIVNIATENGMYNYKVTLMR